MFLIFAACCFESKAQDLGQWLETNEPLVIEYVLSLQPGNSKPGGVTLSNGNVYLNDFLYRHQIDKDRPGSNIHLFEKGGRYLVIIWLSSEAEPLPLPTCAPDSEEAKYPWSRGSLISGDVYTYTAVQPEHGIVISYCPSQAWLGTGIN
jgi:hypothetical protein